MIGRQIKLYSITISSIIFPNVLSNYSKTCKSANDKGPDQFDNYHGYLFVYLFLSVNIFEIVSDDGGG